MIDENEDFTLVDFPPLVENICDLTDDRLLVHKPLLIGCSGGGGHNAAITSLGELLVKRGIDLPKHKPIPYEKKKPSITAVGMFTAAHLQGYPYIQAFCQSVGLPVVPNTNKLHKKIKELEKNNLKERSYIDILLDAYKPGYECVAAWDIHQGEDQKEGLSGLVNWQSENDRLHKQDVYTYFLDLLNQAYENNKPYTEILCTQANGLAGLCKAVDTYNKQHLTQLIIHQYMTDLPTSGAVHFFRALASLKPYQQAHMKLYAVDLSYPVLKQFFTKGNHFAAIYTIHPKRNPMVRVAFYDSAYSYYDQFHRNVTLHPTVDETLEEFNHLDVTILPNETIATIMLGSQAGQDTIRYLLHLIDHGLSKIFIFAGMNQALKKQIMQMMLDEPQLKNQIILMGLQQAPLIAGLMSRSNILIIRAGGLTVMEQMAMRHNPEQLIFIHHADTESGPLTSGIAWEDQNTERLIIFLAAEGICVIKTSPSRIVGELRSRMGERKNNSNNELDSDWQIVNQHEKAFL